MKQLNELEDKVPIFKKWRKEKNDKKTQSEKKKHTVFVECQKLSTKQYPVFLSYKPLSFNKFHVNR